MEDILASIKKIIAEDADRKISPMVRRANVRLAEEVVPVADEEHHSTDAGADLEDVLELSVPEEAAPEEVVGVPDESTDSELVSVQAALASRAALASLGGLAPSAPAASETSLESLVRSLLQPMLKDWLDAHLPEVVERIVAREVARISGRPL